MERERSDRPEKAAREKLYEQHKAAGVTLYEYDDTPVGLVWLASMPTAAGKGIEPQVHLGCPVRQAIIGATLPERAA